MGFNSAMLKTPRGLAVEILNRVELTNAYAEPLLDVCLSTHDLPNIYDRRLLTELVYGTLRRQGRLDWLVRKYYRGNFPSLNTAVKNIIRSGLYQLIYTSRIPAFAVVDEAVKLARVLHPGSEALVNALLRNYLRKKGAPAYPLKEEDLPEYISAVYSHPAWLVKRWLKTLGEEGTIALCRENNEAPPVALRVNRLKITRKKAIEELKEESLEAGETPFSPDGLVLSGHGSSLRETAGYKQGHFLLQDEASQIIAHLLAPQPGEQVLDICAGVGVKTTQLAEIMENKGYVLAVDIHENKLATLRELADRLGIGIVETRPGDAADPGSLLSEKFDRVLVDAPCSGLGTLRRNPEIKWRLRARDIKAFAELQKKILGGGAAGLKRGGILVYSVCTVIPEENEAVVEAFLSRCRNFRSVAPPETINRSLIDEQGFFRTSPDRHGTDGFFGAVLVKD